jgi:prevent-host-death family protein
MREKTVGIRELKAQLSAYLKEVKNGSTVVITERGRPVGRIIPAGEPLEEKMQHLIRSGDIAWSGRKLQAGHPAVKLRRGRKTIAEIVSENRD